MSLFARTVSMLPSFLIPETTIHANGTSEVLDLGGNARAILVTLGIVETVEQESLTVSLRGSKDGTEWSAVPLSTFPEKFYAGTSSVMVDSQAEGLEGGPFRHLRAEWKVNRWGRGSKTPMFRLYLFAERAESMSAR